jgi:hypothetical protein
VETRRFLLDEDDDDDDAPHSPPAAALSGTSNDGSSRGKNIDHHDWSAHRVTPVTKKQTISHPLLCSPDAIMKQCKKKRESFVGTKAKSGIVRATLRKKVS